MTDLPTPPIIPSELGAQNVRVVNLGVLQIALGVALGNIITVVGLIVIGALSI